MAARDRRPARLTATGPTGLIRNSDGEVRWMEVRDWLKRATHDGRAPVKQIVFKRFDVMSVRRWRDRVLGEAGAG